MRAGAKTSAGTLPDPKILRVLIVEDTPADAELAARALKSSDWTLDWRRVTDAEAFGRALDEDRWSVILADYSVPGLGALAAIEIVRQRELDIPLIVLSGTIGEQMASTLLRAGAADFLMKRHLDRLRPVAERALHQAAQRQEKQQADQGRRIFAERWQLLLDHAGEGVVVHQAIREETGRMVDYRHLEWNQAAERILGVPRDVALRRTGLDLFPGVASSGLLDCYRRVLETGRPEQLEDYQTRSTPRSAILDISVARLDDQHFVALCRDVTERKRSAQRLREYALEVAQANEALQEANAELAKRNVELEEFAHVASHDLQEPLRKVVSFGDLLVRALGDKLDAKPAQYLGLMQDASRRLQALIRDLLVMSRAGRAPLHRKPTSLEHCVREALDLLSARIQETGAAVEVAPLPTLVVDPAQICQLYQNLISNALKFHAPAVTPHIRITCEDVEQGLVLGVADNGIGIESEYHEKIFEAFQRLHGRDKYDGSGIGLAVCRKIVQRHEGSIWVESRPGEGAHFRFRLGKGEPAAGPQRTAASVAPS